VLICCERPLTCAIPTLTQLLAKDGCPCFAALHPHDLRSGEPTVIPPQPGHERNARQVGDGSSDGRWSATGTPVEPAEPHSVGDTFRCDRHRRPQRSARVARESRTGEPLFPFARWRRRVIGLSNLAALDRRGDAGAGAPLPAPPHPGP
jgi:hypothetical protein